MKTSKKLTKTISYPIFKQKIYYLSNLTITYSRHITSTENSPRINQKTYEALNYSKLEDYNLVELKFRMFLNTFNEDHYIFKLEFHPNTTLKDIEKYFIECPTFIEIKMRNFYYFNDLKYENKQNKQNYETSCIFKTQKIKLQKDLTARQLYYIVYKSKHESYFIDFSYHWTLKIYIQKPKYKKSYEMYKYRYFCTIM